MLYQRHVAQLKHGFLYVLQSFGAGVADAHFFPLPLGFFPFASSGVSRHLSTPPQSIGSMCSH